MSRFANIVKNPFKFKLFLLSKLPNGFFTGLKIETLDDEKCAVSIKYKWFNKNPFKSTYFASLAMAAELSTGALAMQSVEESGKKLGMLVVKVEGSFMKKAVGKTVFRCVDGTAFKKTIQDCIEDQSAHTFTSTSIGTNELGEEISKFLITWSFKLKSN